MIASALDCCLALSLVFLAWQSLRARDIFVSVVLFIVFGLIMALAWVRMQAPDIALVEAAIGSGLTGALFLGVLGRMETGTETMAPSRQYAALIFSYPEKILMILSTGLGALFCWTIFNLPTETEGLRPEVTAALPQSGAENPVTAVILNLRGYDTLLEIGVLFLVAVAVYALYRFEPLSQRHPASGSRVLNTFLHTLIPLMILLAMYMLWAGGYAPGGAFQAGAILAGAGILLLLGGVPLPLTVDKPLWRFALTAGFIGFLSVGVLVMHAERNFLEYPAGTAKGLILLIETLATASIALTLLSLFAGCTGFLGWVEPAPENEEAS